MHVTVIAKSPVPGRVKTRLCPPCTLQQAADLAEAGIIDTIEAIDRALPSQSTVRKFLLLDGELQPWMPSDWDVVAQRGSGLGERLRNGFTDLGPGAIVGMETPHVAGLLPAALDLIRDGHDLLGPAEDGGYWMIGLCAETIVRVADVFDAVPMSTADTGAAQLERLHSVGRSTRLLPTARDLDNYDDLRAIATAGRDGRLAVLASRIVSSLDVDQPAASALNLPELPITLDNGGPCISRHS